MFLQTGCNSENVWIEDDVARWKVSLFGQQFVSARANVDFALEIVRLAPFVESHHNHSRAITTNQSGLPQKFVLAVFQANRVHDALALQTLQSRFDHAPFRAVDHDWDSRDLRFAPDQVEEPRHGRFRIDHALVHVDVENVCAVLNLLACNGERAIEVSA